MSVKKRLKDFIKSIGMTVSAWEKSIGASNGYVNSISTGIGEDKRKAILEVYSNLNFDWLITGRGEMTISNENNYISFDEINVVRETNSIELNEIYWKGRYDELSEQFERLRKELEELKHK